MLQAGLLAFNAVKDHMGVSKSHHLQVVLVLELQTTVFTIVLVVSLLLHVLICCGLRVELQAAGFACYLRRPMSQAIHMLIGRVLRAKLLGASLTFEAWRPVACVVHVLVASTLGTEGSSATFAFGPVAIVGHVVLAVILVPEAGCAGLALVHLKQW